MIKSDVISEDDDGPEAKKALGRQNEDLDDASRATAGAPRPRAQPHALFFSRGGKQKKIEVHKMSASAKKCLRPSPGAEF